MANTSQLIKENKAQGGHSNVFPKTFIDAIKDRDSGKILGDILSSFNMYFLSYIGSREATRLLVPKFLRKPGLWITYVLFDGTVINEYYIGTSIEDDEFKRSENWKDITNSLNSMRTTDANNNGSISTYGTTQQRPTTTYINVGFQYFDTTLNKPIWWAGMNWVDSTGASV